MIKCGRKTLLEIIMLVILAVGIPLAGSSFGGLFSLMSTTLVYGIYAMGYDILYGFTHQTSYGHSLYFGLGAYGFLISVRSLQLGFFPAILVGILLAAIFAIAIGMFAVRLPESYFVITTIILVWIGYYLAMNMVSLTGGDDGLSMTVPPISLGFIEFSIYDPLVSYLAFFAFFLASLLILKRLVSSHLGKLFVAIRTNPNRVEFLGYNLFYGKFIAYVVSAIFTGLAGALLAITFRYASASYFAVNYSVLPIIFCVLGGAGTLWGGFIGAFIYLIFLYFVSAAWANYLIIFGVLLIVIVKFSPKGILGTIGKKIKVS